MQHDTIRPATSLRDLVREVIADLADQRNPTPTAILEATTRHVGSRATLPAQVRAQVVAGVTAGYFQLYRPGPRWSFGGRDLAITTGTTELVWVDDDGAILLDAVLAEARPTRAQMHAAIRELTHLAKARYGPSATCLRLLVPRNPQLSRTFAPPPPDGEIHGNHNPTTTLTQRTPLARNRRDHLPRLQTSNDDGRA